MREATGRVRHFIAAGLVLALLFFVSGCQSETERPTDAPALDIAAYFTGDIKAWGIVQDWRGRVVARFDADMKGVWEGSKGRLEEAFVFYDGATQERVWNITKKDDGSYEGRAGDVVGLAVGKQVGRGAVYWTYVMDIEVEGRSYRLTFDDRMWLMHDGILVNKAKMKKFGLTVGSLTVFMQKTGSPLGP